MKDILIVTSRSPSREDASSMLRESALEAAKRLGQEINVANLQDVKRAMGSIQEQIIAADVVLADVSGSRQDVMYELGFAHGRDRPTILVSDDESRPTLYDLAADFLASDFVVQSELPALLAAAEKRGTKILPVILKPCRFLRDARLSVFQALNDPRRPLIGLPEVEQEEVYARLADRIENELRGSTDFTKPAGIAVEQAAAAEGAPRRG